MYEVDSFKCLGAFVADQGFNTEVLSRTTETTAALARLKTNSEAQRSDLCAPWLSQYYYKPANLDFDGRHPNEIAGH